MKRVLAAGLAALALAGCKSHPLSVTVSPRLIGRVVAADTGQPLAEVKVRVGGQPEGYDRTVPPKGGEVMKARAAVFTDREGRFVLEPERVLAPFRGTGWFAVQLFFERAGYERFWTNYSLLNLSTNSWKGAPALSTGDIQLQRATK